MPNLFTNYIHLWLIIVWYTYYSPGFLRRETPSFLSFLHIMAWLSSPSKEILVIMGTLPTTWRPSASTTYHIPSNWFVEVNLRHHTSYFKHNNSPHIYHLNNGELTLFKINKSPKTRLKAAYLNVPYQCELRFNETDFIPVDIHVNDWGISILENFPTFHHCTSNNTRTFKEVIESLPPSLKCICGTLTLPPDDGAKLITSLESSNKSILACNDASLKDNRAVHTWIISSGDINDITDPYMQISGSGPIDGSPQYLSLARAELTGLTALAITIKLFRECYNSRANFTILCDNQGMLKKFELIPFHHLRFHHEKNVDLLLSHHHFSSNVPVTYSLVEACKWKAVGFHWGFNKTMSVTGMKFTTYGWIKWQIRNGPKGVHQIVPQRLPLPKNGRYMLFILNIIN
jgi:hypothetical protein